MSVHCILGKPGSGKSLYAVSRLILELRETRRNIVTNLPVHLGRLNEYVQQKWPNDDLRVIQRVRVLTDDELKEFWKFRGVDQDDQGTDGVAYYLDEAHIAFNARDWASIGRGALHYLSQHRKLGDIVWVITQAPGNLDKQFRSISEDFSVLRNEYTAKFGPFRGRGRFVRRTYLQEPQQNAEPFETATFTLDKEGIASCYDTAKGIGVHGNKADIGRRAKGIPIWVVVPGALVLALSCVFLPMMLGRGVSRFVQGKPITQGPGAKVAPVRQDTVVPGVALPGQTGRAPAVEEKPAKPVAVPEILKPSPSPAVWVTGYVVRGGKINLTLSDGRTLMEEDGILDRVTRTYAETKQGERFWMRKPADGVRSSGLGSQPASPPVPKVEPVTVQEAVPGAGSWVTGADGVTRLKEVPKDVTQTTGRSGSFVPATQTAKRRG